MLYSKLYRIQTCHIGVNLFFVSDFLRDLSCTVR